MKHNTSTKKHSTGKATFIAMVVVAIVFIAVIVRIIFLLIPGKVQLDEFITLELSGYNTVGEAQIAFDYNSFIEEYGEKIKFKSDAARTQFIQDYPDSAELIPAAAWLKLAKVGLSQYDGLSNGDSVTLRSNSADSAAKTYFNCVADYNGAVYTVEGLKEPGEINILEDLTVTFEGYSPNISVTSAELASKWDVFENLTLDISKTEHLAENESIEVSLATIDGTDLNDYLATCGYMTPTTTRTIETSGDGHYISSTDEIPADVMDQLKTRSETLYTNYLSTKNGSNYQWTHDINYMNYMGSVLLTSKDTASTDTANTLYLVYEVSTYITAKPSANSRTTYKNNVLWNFVTQYDNIALKEDGTLNIVPSELSLNQFGEVGFVADDELGISEIYYGYAALNDISTQLIDPYTNVYDCENKLNTSPE